MILKAIVANTCVKNLFSMETVIEHMYYMKLKASTYVWCKAVSSAEYNTCIYPVTCRIVTEHIDFVKYNEGTSYSIKM